MYLHNYLPTLHFKNLTHILLTYLYLTIVWCGLYMKGLMIPTVNTNIAICFKIMKSDQKMKGFIQVDIEIVLKSFQVLLKMNISQEHLEVLGLSWKLVLPDKEFWKC